MHVRSSLHPRCVVAPQAADPQGPRDGQENKQPTGLPEEAGGDARVAELAQEHLNGERKGVAEGQAGEGGVQPRREERQRHQLPGGEVQKEVVPYPRRRPTAHD